MWYDVSSSQEILAPLSNPARLKSESLPLTPQTLIPSFPLLDSILNKLQACFLPMMASPTEQQLIGLTGGIATGKSTVGAYLQNRYHIPILDADGYARDAVQPNSPILTAIAERYGPEILHKDGGLNRSKLGDIIFNNMTEKAWVESQIHPYVQQSFYLALTELTQAPMVVLMIPLLFEAQLTDWVTEIWVVACGPDTQLKRLMARNGLTQAQAQARIDSQMPLAEKISQADVVLNNDQSLGNLYHQIDLVLRK